MNCGPDMGQIWCISLVSGLHVALLWFARSPDLANRSGPPKCHHHVVCGPHESDGCGPDMGHSNFAIWEVCDFMSVCCK